MKTYSILFAVAILAFMGCAGEEIAIPQAYIQPRESKPEPPPPPPPPIPDCEFFDTNHDLDGTIDDVENNGQWFSIQAEGTVTSYLGTGSSIVSMLYNTKSGILEGNITANFDSLYMDLYFSTTAFSPGSVTIDFPQVSGGVTTAGQVFYTMTTGSMVIDLPVMQEGSVSIECTSAGEYCNEDPGGIGCWAGNG